jgi:hypothetical protein
MDSRAKLIEGLNSMSALLHRYERPQAAIPDRILDMVSRSTPDYSYLVGLDIWGGSGSVSDTILAQPGTGAEAKADDKLLRGCVIQVAEAMDELGLGTVRSKWVADVFRKWRDSNI